MKKKESRAVKKAIPHSVYKTIACVCLFFGVFWTYKAVSCFIDDKTDAFTILGISSNRSFNPSWEVHPLSLEEKAELESAIDQPYHYLACGSQAYVFISQDERYVIKFFNQKVFKVPLLWGYMPSQWLQDGKPARKIWKREDKLARDFTSYKLAFDELKEETGLTLVHLNKTDWINKKLKITDKINIEHQIDLDQFEFIIQKRAELVYPYLERLLGEGEREKAKEALSDILRIFAVRCQKGINDSPPDLDKNFGFIDGKAVQIDIGRFTKHAKKIRFEKRNDPVILSPLDVGPPAIKDSFKIWLAALDPELFEYFNREYIELCEKRAFNLPASSSKSADWPARSHKVL